MEYLRLARLVFPAFAVLYFFGRGIGAFESETLSDENVGQFLLAIIGTAALLAVFEAMARSDKARFQGKLPLALDNFQRGDAKEARPCVETVFEAGDELARSKTRLRAGRSATFRPSVDASTAEVKVASRFEGGAGETETFRRTFASLAESVERAEARPLASKRQTPSEEPRRPAAVEVKAAETEAGDERERKLDAEERRERERLRKYDASPSRLSKYDR